MSSNCYYADNIQWIFGELFALLQKFDDQNKARKPHKDKIYHRLYLYLLNTHPLIDAANHNSL